LVFSAVHQPISTSDLTVIATFRLTTHRPRWSNTPVSPVDLGCCFLRQPQIRSPRYVICHRPWTAASPSPSAGRGLMHLCCIPLGLDLAVRPLQYRSTVTACAALLMRGVCVPPCIPPRGLCRATPLLALASGIFQHRCTMEAFLDGSSPSLAFVMSSPSDRRSPSGALIKAPRVRLPSPTLEVGDMMHGAYNISPRLHNRIDWVTRFTSSISVLLFASYHLPF